MPQGLHWLLYILYGSCITAGTQEQVVKRLICMHQPARGFRAFRVGSMRWQRRHRLGRTSKTPTTKRSWGHASMADASTSYKGLFGSTCRRAVGVLPCTADLLPLSFSDLLTLGNSLKGCGLTDQSTDGYQYAQRTCVCDKRLLGSDVQDSDHEEELGTCLHGRRIHVQ
jgi:hypothetical protein